MNVNIVCSIMNRDRILPRMARILVEGTGWSASSVADPDADINYYFPYLEVRKATTLSGRTVGLFTHNETLVPGKVAVWENVASMVDLRITWAEQYEEQLQQYGETVRIVPPLDRDFFQPEKVLRAPNTQIVVGISGYVYSGGRKGERLIAEVLKTDIGKSFDWQAIGRGWPRQLKTKLIAFDALPAFYQGLDLYVCPSLIEGIPYGPLEALACGVPVIIPRGVGMLDELGDVRGIIRYEAGNSAALEAALNEGRTQIEFEEFDSEELRAVTKQFTTEAWVEGHLAAFDKLDERAETARQSDHGIYVVAFGEPARDCAQRLIASIRRYMPNTPVAVASDRPVPGADLYVAAPDEDLGGRAAKTHMWDLAPDWEHVLYLDADTELIAPITFLFDALRDGWEMVCTKDVKNYETISELWRRDSEEHKMGWEAIGSDRALQLAGGVICFRRTLATEAFLNGWYTEWKRMARRDQGALVRSLYAHPVRLLVLGNHWNRFEGGICPEEPAGIIHHRGGPARRVGGWKAGRMDSPEAFEGVHRVRTLSLDNGKGVEGVIRSGARRFHIGASVSVIYNGLKTTRRQGRTGRNYIFSPRIPVTVTGEDASHVVRPGEPEWEVGVLECPVCHAPDGACTGEGIEAKESNMEKNNRPMLMVEQEVPPERGVAGYVGQEEGLVKTFKRTPRFPDNGVAPSLKDKLAGMTDEELEALGVKRPESDGPELHEFEPNRGGVNCKECRKNEENGDHLAPPVVAEKTKTDEPANTKLVGETKRPAAKRHTPTKAKG